MCIFLEVEHRFMMEYCWGGGGVEPKFNANWEIWGYRLTHHHLMNKPSLNGPQQASKQATNLTYRLSTEMINRSALLSPTGVIKIT